MVTLLIEHPITEFATWLKAFDDFAERRHAAGVLAEHIYQPHDDPRYVLITLEFAEASRATAFCEFLQTKVWADRAASPGLNGQPRTAVLEHR